MNQKIKTIAEKYIQEARLQRRVGIANLVVVFLFFLFGIVVIAWTNNIISIFGILDRQIFVSEELLFYTDLSIRISVLFLLYFYMRVYINFSRYNTRITDFCFSRKNILMLLDDDLDDKKIKVLMQLLSPEKIDVQETNM